MFFEYLHFFCNFAFAMTNAKHIILTALILSVLGTANIFAQQKSKPAPKPPICIIDEIQEDSVNVIILPEGLWELLDYDEPTKKGPVQKMVNPKPFTVQVYNDKSRDEANARAAKVQARFPQYHVRRYYSSPYFRVYLGAFETSQDAQKLVAEVKRAFPSFAAEVHWTKTGVGGTGKRK